MNFDEAHIIILDAISRDGKTMSPDFYPKPFRQFLGTKYEKILTGFEVIFQGFFSSRWILQPDITRTLHSLLLASRVYLSTLEELHLIELKDGEYFITKLGKAVLEFVP